MSAHFAGIEVEANLEIALAGEVATLSGKGGHLSLTFPSLLSALRYFRSLPQDGERSRKDVIQFAHSALHDMSLKADLRGGKIPLGSIGRDGMHGAVALFFRSS